MIDACNQPETYQAMRKAARDTALRVFDKDSVGLPSWMALIHELIGPGR